MLLISILAVLLMISNVSSFAIENLKLNQTLANHNVFSKRIPMYLVHRNTGPLRPLNHELINMPQTYTPSAQHETLRLLERLEVQPNYYNPRNMKGKLLMPAWQVPRLPGTNNFEKLPTERSSFNSQIPRPPRLSRTMSENRRRYMETPVEQPRPFNFPLDGPQPSEFKKTKKSKKENSSHNKAKKVNNIQDILRQEPVMSSNRNQMPVGIHISGSFKNLQNSGISNVFRRYAQLQPAMSPGQFAYQRIAFDPFYPYKPKSLSDINSLAMKQLGLKQKNKKKNPAKLIPGLMYQQSGHRPVSADYYLDALRMNNSLNSFGSVRNLKTEPFSLKLEVFPIRSGNKMPVVPVIGPQFVTTIRPQSVQNFEPFYPQMPMAYGMPIDNGAGFINYGNHQQQYKARFPLYTNAQQPESEKAAKSSENQPKTSANQMMVHLNVFPSKKENKVPVPQNHLYDVIHADVHERSSAGTGVRNDTSSTLPPYVDCETDEKLFDDEAEASEHYQHRVSDNIFSGPSKVLSGKGTDFFQDQRHNVTHEQARNTSENVEENKMSTFRFPVENLMQFQANDAVI